MKIANKNNRALNVDVSKKLFVEFETLRKDLGITKRRLVALALFEFLENSTSITIGRMRELHRKYDKYSESS